MNCPLPTLGVATASARHSRHRAASRHLATDGLGIAALDAKASPSTTPSTANTPVGHAKDTQSAADVRRRPSSAIVREERQMRSIVAYRLSSACRHNGRRVRCPPSSAVGQRSWTSPRLSATLRSGGERRTCRSGPAPSRG